jgi:hypothetical protein
MTPAATRKPAGLLFVTVIASSRGARRVLSTLLHGQTVVNYTDLRVFGNHMSVAKW